MEELFKISDEAIEKYPSLKYFSGALIPKPTSKPLPISPGQVAKLAEEVCTRYDSLMEFIDSDELSGGDTETDEESILETLEESIGVACAEFITELAFHAGITKVYPLGE